MVKVLSRYRKIKSNHHRGENKSLCFIDLSASLSPWVNFIDRIKNCFISNLLTAIVSGCMAYKKSEKEINNLLQKKI